MPEELTSAGFSNFLCYSEWACEWRYAVDNVMDPMHGTFLHKQSHSMAEGDSTASFRVRDTEGGFVFEKTGQRGVNFDWTEWGGTHLHWMRLEIPYPPSGGPGGNFAIVACATPINERLCAVFFWRCRRVDGWQRDAWRFLYRNRLEARHWAVLEQDRVMLEQMEPDANQHEHLYQHDIGLVRLRRLLKKLATEQVEAEAAR
jgi:phenylpropionate dioxygenase-like ring-hydroxylating dioxygenase large terminal subunit